MDRRSYDQYCCLAVALDHIGDRWTLLIIRELLFGPRRYADLRAALPGVATNLLAARLRSLQADDIVSRRRIPPPAPATVYELTDAGRALEPSLIELVRWGARWMGQPPEGAMVRASWVGLALTALLRRPAKGIRGDYDLLVGGELLRLRASGGRIAIDAVTDPEASDRPPALARLTSTPAAVLAIATGGSSIEGEILAGRAVVEGSPEAIRDLSAILAFG